MVLIRLILIGAVRDNQNATKNSLDNADSMRVEMEGNLKMDILNSILKQNLF